MVSILDGTLSKSRGCKESLNEVVMTRIEIDFCPKVNPMKQSKYWAVSKDAGYYYVKLLTDTPSNFSFSMQQIEIIGRC